MLTPTVPYRKTLPDGLVLKSIAGERDVERVATFHDEIRDWEVADSVRELILRHPNTRPEHWLYVEDEGTGQVVSSLCLIPWTWRYEGVELKAGEMAIVGTLPAYRHRGLVRALVERFDELLREGGYDLSHIQGIPYFYRQFGYEYALPLKGGWRLELHQVGDPPQDEPPPYAFRLAAQDDLPALARLYAEASRELSIHTARSEEVWRYLLGPSTRTDQAAETWLISDEGGTAVGYLRVPTHDFGDGLVVREVSRMDAGMAVAALHFLKTLSIEREQPYIQLNLPQESALIQVARARGAHDEGRYPWQIRIVDVAGLLRKLSSIFERRLAASPLAGRSRTVCLNLYREAYDLRFERGKLAAVEALGFREEGHIRLPPFLLAPLLLGYKSRQELAQNYPDVLAWGEDRIWADVLFPKCESFIYSIY